MTPPDVPDSRLRGRLQHWFSAQVMQGVPPTLRGSRLRCQYITNATPALVLLTVLLFMGLFSLAGLPALVRSTQLALPVACAGVLWFRVSQARGRCPSYWEACLVCQATVLTGIFGGQGTLISTHFYFLFFALTAPLVIPVSDRWALAAISLECLAVYVLLEVVGVPAHPSVQALSADATLPLRLSVFLGCALILFAATLMSEVILDRLERRITALAHTDALTGLANRRQFQLALDAALARRDGTLCVAMLDLDHFKAVNDRHGHETGDDLLRAVAQGLLQARRQADLVARVGGEEFAVLLADTGLEQAAAAMERHRQAIGALRLRLDDGQVVRGSASVGVAALQPGDTARSLLAAADRALYAAKQAGRNRVCLADRAPGGPG